MPLTPKSSENDIVDIQMPIIEARRSHSPFKVLLVHPRDSNTLKPIRLPIGLMSLASCLKSPHFVRAFLKRKYFHNDAPFLHSDLIFPVQILDLQAESPTFDLTAFLRDWQFDIVGVTAVTALINEAKEIAKTCASVSPQTARILGGVHFSALPEETLRESVFQFGLQGQAEESLIEVALSLRFGWPNRESIQGLYYKLDNGEVLRNPRRIRVMRFDEYPYPAESLDLLKLDGYEQNLGQYFGTEAGVGQFGTLMTTRGCPTGRCSFCASRVIFGREAGNRPFESRSAESLLHEIGSYYRRGITRFFIIDDVFTSSEARLEKFTRLLEAAAIKICYSAMTRADMVNERKASLLKRSGCTRIAIGVESGDQALLDNTVGKGIRLDRVSKARSVLRAEGIPVKYYLMVGLPDQTWNSIALSVEMIMRDRPDQIDAAVTIPYPGTELYADTRIAFIGGETKHNYENYRHGSLLHVESLAPCDVVTQSNVMSAKEIGTSRDILLVVHRATYDPVLLHGLHRKVGMLVAGYPSALSVFSSMNWSCRPPSTATFHQDADPDVT